MWSQLFLVEAGRLRTRVERAQEALGFSLVGIGSGDEPAALVDSAVASGADALWALGPDKRRRAEVSAAATARGLASVGLSPETLAALASEESLRAAADAAGLRIPEGSPAGQGWHRLELVVCRDAEGNEVALDERDTTLHEGDRPLFTETPSPLLSLRSDGEAIRMAAGELAIALARALSAVGVLRVTLAFDAEGRLWFVDADADDQGAAAATEALLGIDTTALSLSIARGGAAPDVTKLFRRGHACEAWAYGEADVEMPTVEALAGTRGRELRVEAAGDLGWAATDGAHALACFTTYADTRPRAVQRLDRALALALPVGMPVEVRRVRAMLHDEAFRAGSYDTASASRIDLAAFERASLPPKGRAPKAAASP